MAGDRSRLLWLVQRGVLPLMTRLTAGLTAGAQAQSGSGQAGESAFFLCMLTIVHTRPFISCVFLILTAPLVSGAHSLCSLAASTSQHAPLRPGPVPDMAATGSSSAGGQPGAPRSVVADFETGALVPGSALDGCGIKQCNGCAQTGTLLKCTCMPPADVVR